MSPPLPALALAALFATSTVASGATVTIDREDKGNPRNTAQSIWLSGEIAPGDADRVRELIAEARRQGRTFFAIYLDSPGGSLMEGLRLGQTIREAGAVTVLLSYSTCASACILAFAGGKGRMAYRGARLGVYGASESGRETTAAMAGTLAMARLASRLGVPDAIVTKIIMTPPESMTWLTSEEIGEVAGRGVIDREEFGQ